MSWRATGFRAWLLQRVSAAYMAIFLVWLALSWLVNKPHDFQSWQGWIGGTFTSIGVALFFIAMLFHAWVGIRDVAIDYLRPFQLRFLVLAVVAFSLAGMGFWVLRILVGIST